MNEKYSKEEIDTLKAMGYRVEDDQIYTKYIVEQEGDIDHHIYNVSNKDLRIYMYISKGYISKGEYRATNLILEPIFKGEENEKILSRSLMSICPTNVHILYDKDYLKPLNSNINVVEYQEFSRSQNYFFKEAREKEPEIHLTISSDLLFRPLLMKVNLDYWIQKEFKITRDCVIERWMNILESSKIMNVCLIQYGMRESYDLSFVNVKDISINDILNYMNEKIRFIYKFTGTINGISSNFKVIEIIPTEIAYVRSFIDKEKYSVFIVNNTSNLNPVTFTDMNVYSFRDLFETNKPWKNMIIKYRSDIEL